MKFYIETLGCKINQYESAGILDDFILAGYQKAQDMSSADVVVINTCTVTNRTDYKSRYLINKAKEIKTSNNALIIIVTGCYSQRNRDELLRSGSIDYIIDNNNKANIINCILHKRNEVGFENARDFIDFANNKLRIIENHSRAFLKIQDGCDFFCSYCAVPYARGNPRSRSLDSIKEQIEVFLANGYQEIILSGINLGLYNAECDLADLLYEIADYKELKKIRLSSIEPQLFTEKLFRAIENIDKICPHFHLPLQTGSDTLLKTHGRKYNSSDVLKKIARLRQIRPHAAIGFDVIVGLPYETDELFMETYTFINKTNPAYLHVFIYSKRKGTRAASMENQTHGAVSKERSKKLLELAKEKKKEYINELINSNILLCAIKESHYKDDIWQGTSDRYIKTYFKADAKKNTMEIIKLKLVKLYIDGVYCEIQDNGGQDTPSPYTKGGIL